MISSRSKKWVLVLMLAILLLSAPSVYAVDDFQSLDQELSRQEKDEAPQSNNLFINFLKLVVVLGLIVAAAWSIIRLFGRQVSRKIQGDWLYVADEVMIGQNRGVVLCEIGGRVYALGVTDGQINLLFEVEDKELVQEVVAAKDSAKTTEPGGVLSWLETKKSSSPAVHSLTENKRFHRMMQDKLLDFQQKTKDITINSETGAKNEKRRH